jgi:hypothetical protein
MISERTLYFLIKHFLVLELLSIAAVQAVAGSVDA